MRSPLRIADLMRGTKTTNRQMNVRIPEHLAEAIGQLAKNVGASKTELMLALLNEGLDVVGKKRGE